MASRHSTGLSPSSPWNKKCYSTKRLFDPAAAEDSVAVVEDGGLAGGDGFLRVLKFDADAVLVNLDDSCAGFFVPGTDLDFDGAQTRIELPVHAADVHGSSVKVAFAADAHLIPFGVYLGHKKRVLVRDLDPFSLTDRVQMAPFLGP